MNCFEEISNALVLSINIQIESWILDSGASFHFFSNHES